MKHMDDCVTSCYMFLGQGFLILLTMYGLRNDFKTLALILASQVVLSYCVFHLFPLLFTDVLMFVLNTLSCVVMPLDILDKLLRTKDLSYVNFPMHILGTINSVIWTLYHYSLGSYFLAAANSTGFLCEMVLGIACLYSVGTIGPKHPGTQFARLWADALYNTPKALLGMGEDRLKGGEAENPEEKLVKEKKIL